VGDESVEETVSGTAGPDHRFDVRTDEPWPHGALVVGAVALGRPSTVLWEVAVIGGVERSQP
jgi:hypothetical protein